MSRNRKALKERLMATHGMHSYCNGYLNGCAIWWHYRPMSRIDRLTVDGYLSPFTVLGAAQGYETRDSN